ncbi:hypothetical protein BHE90_017309, partial [Fusarium euwallaceae]
HNARPFLWLLAAIFPVSTTDIDSIAFLTIQSGKLPDAQSMGTTILYTLALLKGFWTERFSGVRQQRAKPSLAGFGTSVRGSGLASSHQAPPLEQRDTQYTGLEMAKVQASCDEQKRMAILAHLLPRKAAFFNAVSPTNVPGVVSRSISFYSALELALLGTIPQTITLYNASTTKSWCFGSCAALEGGIGVISCMRAVFPSSCARMSMFAVHMTAEQGTERRLQDAPQGWQTTVLWQYY